MTRLHLSLLLLSLSGCRTGQVGMAGTPQGDDGDGGQPGDDGGGSGSGDDGGGSGGGDDGGSSGDGGDGGDGGSTEDCTAWVPSDHATISEAVEAADDGDVVCVSAGTYTETLDLSDRAFVLWGVDGSAATILDGDGVGPVVAVASPVDMDTTLKGFTVTGGDAPAGAGILIAQAPVRLVDVVVAGNTCSHSAGCSGIGLSCQSADINLNGVEIRDNALLDGAGGTKGIGIAMDGCEASLVDVEIRENGYEAGTGDDPSSVLGAGLYLRDSTVSWKGGTLAENVPAGSRASAIGGGAYVDRSTLALANVVVAANDHEGLLLTQSDLSATNVVFAANSGGALAIHGESTAVLENCDIVGAASTAAERAFDCNYASSCGIELTNTSIVGHQAGSLDIRSWSAWTGSVSSSNLFDNGDDEDGLGGAEVGRNGNIAVDPAYEDVTSTDPLQWDLHLGAGSACIDAGSPAIEDPDGSVSDIGVYGGPGAADW